MSNPKKNIRRTMEESTILDPIFDVFRTNPNLNIQWVKEQVYGSPCIPENCPVIIPFLETVKSLELEDGEIRDRDVKIKMKFQ